MPGFSGVGLVSLAERLVSGLPNVASFMGNCPSVKLSLSPDSVERNSSMDTSRGPLRRMTKTTQGSIEITCDEFSKANFTRFVFGRMDSVASGGSVSATAFPTGAVVGSLLLMPDKNVTSVVITDSTGSPKTLVLNTNYELDAFNGSIRILDLTAGGPYVQPLKYAYTKGAVDVIAGLAVPDKEFWLNMAGTNVDTGERGVLDAYRVRFGPAENIDFISDDYVDFTIRGSILQDSTKTAAGVGGNYFKFTVPQTIA